mgnify:CR=1 FL=1
MTLTTQPDTAPLADRGPEPSTDLLTAIPPWVAVAALAAWLGLGFQAVWLGLASAGFLVPLVLRGGLLTRWARGGLLAGLGLVTIGFMVEGQTQRVVLDWDQIRAEREVRIAELLEASLDELLREGRAGVTTLARAAQEGPPPLAVLQRLRRGGRFDAAAIYDAEGQLQIWDGIHRGAVPPEVTAGGPTYQFGTRALARYLYVTEPTPSGGTAMLARKLDSDLPASVRRPGGDLAIQLEEAVDGISLSFSAPDRADPTSLDHPCWWRTVEGRRSLRRTPSWRSGRPSTYGRRTCWSWTSS